MTYSHKFNNRVYSNWFFAICICIPFLLLTALKSEAQNHSLQVVSTGERSYHINAYRVDSGIITIDGRLDEAEWSLVDATTGFTQTAPDPGEPATEKTEVWVMYDDNAIYIGARMYDSAPDSIAATLFRKDGNGYSDWISVGIDSYNDNRTAFVFAVSPRGVRKDVMIFNDDQFDESWDAVWKASANIDEEGWTAEMRIPLSQLRYNGEETNGERSWGVNFLREIARKGEESFWSPIPPESSGLVSSSGRLGNIRNLPESRRLEFLPYVSSQLDRAPGNHENPFYSKQDFGSNIGADVKYGIGSNMTLTATINPDFGQVEVDPAVVNLSAFETFYPERRPFFLEGSEIFNFGFSGNIQMDEPRILHTRRIGRAPQGRVPDSALFTNSPSQTPIAGAVKLSGKTSGGWSVGLLNALTLEQDAQFTPNGESIESIPVEPLSNYTVGRLQRDFRGGQTVTGVMFNSLYRNINTPGLQQSLTDQAYSGGVDFEQSWSDRKYRINGSITGSYISGDPMVIERIQRSSARYYQRPDANHIEINPARTNMSGTHADLMLTSETRNWMTQFRGYQISPGYEVNDMGFQSAADRRLLTGMVIRKQQSPVGVFRNFNFWLASAGTWNTVGEPMKNLSGTGAFLNFKNFWSLNYTVLGSVRSQDDRLTRGGPLAGSPAGISFNINVNSDNRKNLRISPGFSHRRTELDEYSTNVSLAIRYRPHQAATITIRPSLSRNFNATQYVRTVVDPQMTETFGNRYVFADLNQTTLSAQIRVDWTFTPDLSLQIFAQPFVSAGKFSRFKELSRPKSLNYSVYGEDKGSVVYDEENEMYEIDPDAEGSSEFSIGKPDFNIRSLRGNAVLRWEFRPGSTLFLVWQQNRESREHTGVFSATNDFGELFQNPASHTFLVKFSYWFGV